MSDENSWEEEYNEIYDKYSELYDEYNELTHDYNNLLEELHNKKPLDVDALAKITDGWLYPYIQDGMDVRQINHQFMRFLLKHCDVYPKEVKE